MEGKDYREMRIESTLAFGISVMYVYFLEFSLKMCCLYCRTNGNFMLQLDFEPLNALFPRPMLSNHWQMCGLLNRHLSAKMFHDKDIKHLLLEFFKVHNYDGKVIVVHKCVLVP